MDEETELAVAEYYGQPGGRVQDGFCFHLHLKSSFSPSSFLSADNSHLSQASRDHDGSPLSLAADGSSTACASRPSLVSRAGDQ